MKRSGYLRTDPAKVRAWLDRSRKPLPRLSAKRRAQLPVRAQVRAETIERYGRCVGPARHLPGVCWGPTDVHEVVPRGRDSTSWLDPERAVTLCRGHHAFVTSAFGVRLEIARAAGLDVKASPLPGPLHDKRGIA